MNVNGLPPGLQGWVLADVMRQQQQEQAMQQQQMQFRMQQAQQAQQIAQAEEARRAQMHPLQIQNLQAQMRDLAAQRQAATEKTTQEVADKKRREELMAQVAAQLARPDEATALEAVRQAEARGEPANITARNPNIINSLMAQIAPQQFVNQSMRPQNTQPQYTPASPGSMAFNRQTGQFEGPQVPFAPRVEPTPPPVQTLTDAQGRIWERERGGQWRQITTPDGPMQAPPKPAAAKLEAERRKTTTDLSLAISELEKATKDGGLIDQSTGSGIGAAVDTVGRFFGKSTEGAIAAGAMAPIYDLVLKMVPRFEGPQSDKDTQLYQQAAGQLANPAIPNEQKKAAAKEILRLMKIRRGQFISKDLVGTEADAPAAPGGGGGTVIRFDAQGNMLP